MIRILLSTRLGEKRLRQSELAERTHIRPGTINMMYHDISDRISLHELDKICHILECEITDILVRDGANPFDEDREKAKMKARKSG